MSPSKIAAFPENNRTYQIIHDAVKGGYAVGGFCVSFCGLKYHSSERKVNSFRYNTEGVLAVVKAAERCRSPAMIQFFP
jgi:fructose-bisphosphate aldolase class II